MTPLTHHAALIRRQPEAAGWMPIEPGVWLRPDGRLCTFPPGMPPCVLEPLHVFAAPAAPRRLRPTLELVRFPARA